MSVSGRIEAYVHSDSTTPNKGGALVRVICVSEAGSRTEQFIRFAKFAAQYAYAAQARTWEGVCLKFPFVGDELKRVSDELREAIVVTDIFIATLDA